MSSIVHIDIVQYIVLYNYTLYSKYCTNTTISILVEY